MRPRYSLSRLLVFVLFCGVAFAALRFPSSLWASGLFTTSVLLFSTSILVAARSGPHRMTGLGLAVFGWVYLIIAFGPWPTNRVAPPPLLTGPLLDYLQDYIFSDGKTPYLTVDYSYTPSVEPIRSVRGYAGPATTMPMGGMKVLNPLPYRQVGHSLGAILFGCLGAIIGVFLGNRDRGDETRQHVHSSI